jgi:hypothetical protein
LKTIFEKSNTPADDNAFEQRHLPVFQMPYQERVMKILEMVRNTIVVITAMLPQTVASFQPYTQKIELGTLGGVLITWAAEIPTEILPEAGAAATQPGAIHGLPRREDH